MFRGGMKTVGLDDATAGAVARTGDRLLCQCLAPQDTGHRLRELKFHSNDQDTQCDAWKQMLKLVEQAGADEREVFEPGAEMDWEEWIKIITLPESISRLKNVKELRLYGSNLVRIPCAIGEMSNLEVFDIYTSYRLHWLPYEITRCSKLRDSRISTRALYGNHKSAIPFPKLPASNIDLQASECSICRGPFDTRGPRQRWISLNIATDVVPLLIHACSAKCIENLPSPAQGYIDIPHEGGVDLRRPTKL